MPNWCNNNAHISHPDTEMMNRLIKAFEEGRFCSEFIPTPQELLDTVSPCQNEKQRRSNIKKYGYEDWYTFQTKNWGTKWDIGGTDCKLDKEENDNNVYITFDSAWSPPIGIYEKLFELGYTVLADYYESGIGYVGKFENGKNVCLKIERDSKWVKENIPAELDELYLISNQMEEWEKEDGEESEEDEEDEKE